MKSFFPQYFFPWPSSEASSTAPGRGGEEGAVEAEEAGGVLVEAEALHLHHVALLLLVAGVGEGDLLAQVLHQPEQSI